MDSSRYLLHYLALNKNRHVGHLLCRVLGYERRQIRLLSFSLPLSLSLSLSLPLFFFFAPFPPPPLCPPLRYTWALTCGIARLHDGVGGSLWMAP